MQTKLVDAKREGERIGEDKILDLFRQGHTVEEVERMLAKRGRR